MDDLKPFVHGSEETHYCCNTRSKKEGSKARCCECVPHQDCDSKIDRERLYIKKAVSIWCESTRTDEDGSFIEEDLVEFIYKIMKESNEKLLNELRHN